MKRSSALVGTAAAAAVLVAGSVAALAAINTAASSAPAIENVAVVDDQPMASGTLPPIEIAPLPEIVPVAPAAPVIVDAVELTPSTASPSAKSGDSPAKPKVQSSSTPMSQEARSLTAEQASSIVMGQVEGSATVSDVSRIRHDGYDSWAVTVDKADGSRLVGFVFTGATGNEVFDWKVLKEPKPIVVAAPNAPTTTNPARGDDEHESEHHESEHHEHEGDHDDD
jgi:hypothetical protein